MIAIDPAILTRLGEQDVKFCLIGGFALAARGYPRYTADVDLLTQDRRVLEEAFWSGVVPKPDVRQGDATDPLFGVVRWSTSLPIDLVVAGGHASKLAVETATEEGQAVLVATALALVLLKLQAGGRFDLDDAARLIEVQARLGHADLVDNVAAHLSKIGDDARAAWPKVLTRLAED